MTRREWIRRTVGALLATQVPLPTSPYAPYVAASAGSLQLAELNAVTQAAIMPAVVDNFFQTAPVLACLRDRTAHTETCTRLSVPFLEQ